jgi:hypothetical protein
MLAVNSPQSIPLSLVIYPDSVNGYDLCGIACGEIWGSAEASPSHAPALLNTQSLPADIVAACDVKRIIINSTSRETVDLTLVPLGSITGTV